VGLDNSIAALGRRDLEVLPAGIIVA
jgi:hypothetical protein